MLYRLFKVLRKYVKYSLPKKNVNNLTNCVMQTTPFGQFAKLAGNFYCSPR